MSVRAATPDDCAAIARLNEVVQQHHADALPDLFKPAPAEGLPESHILDLMGKDGVFMALAELDGNAAGYVYAQVVRRPESAQRYAMNIIYIHHIAVLPAFRGRGAGRELVDHVRARAGKSALFDFSRCFRFCFAAFISCSSSTGNIRRTGRFGSTQIVKLVATIMQNQGIYSGRRPLLATVDHSTREILENRSWNDADW